MKTLDTTKREITERLDSLTQPQLEAVLALIERLRSGELPSIPGKELADFFRRFSVTKEEAEEMGRILEEIEHQG